MVPENDNLLPTPEDGGISLPSAGDRRPVAITEAPRIRQDVVHNGREYTTVKEGLAYILVPHNNPTVNDPKAPKDSNTQTQSVFYNPIQQFNRDLSVLAIRAFGEDLTATRRRRSERRNQQVRRKERRHDGVQKREHGDVHESAGEPSPSVEEHERKRIRTERGPVAALPNSALADGAKDVGDLEEQNPFNDRDINDEDLVACEGVLNPQNSKLESKQGGHETNANAAADDEIILKKPKFRILDALSATGLRALRYAQELPFVTSVTANDLSPKATQSIELNIKHNRLENRIFATTGNALALMYSLTAREGPSKPDPKYEVIDLDPYGTAAPFVDAAVQATTDGGLLCVTCTDSSIFASTGYPEKTYSQYGGLPSKGFHSHEVGLRLILHAIALSAARYGVAIEPLLSLSIDFYARVFVRVKKSPAEVKFLAGKTMLVYECDAGCGAWQTQFLARNQAVQGKKGAMFYKHSLAQAPTASPFCEHCGFKTHLSGPMYGGPLHNPAFIERILSYLPQLDKDTYATTERIEGMLRTAYEETLLDEGGAGRQISSEDPNLIPQMDPVQVDHHPFYFNISSLAKVLHCQAPSDAVVKGALRHAGFKVSRSHTKPGTAKTDAPWTALWEIMREWVRQRAPVKEGAVKKGMAGWRIMHQEASTRKEADANKGLAENSKGDNAGAAATHVDENTTAASTGGEDGTRHTVKKFEVVFDEQLGRDKERKITRYQLNPRPNWGPMTRAK